MENQQRKYHPIVIDTETNMIVCCQFGITAFPFMIHASQRKKRTIVPRILLPRWFQVRSLPGTGTYVTLERKGAEAIIQAGQ